MIHGCLYMFFSLPGPLPPQSPRNSQESQVLSAKPVSKTRGSHSRASSVVSLNRSIRHESPSILSVRAKSSDKSSPASKVKYVSQVPWRLMVTHHIGCPGALAPLVTMQMRPHPLQNHLPEVEYAGLNLSVFSISKTSHIVMIWSLAEFIVLDATNGSTLERDRRMLFVLGRSIDGSVTCSPLFRS
jgi:hypothetical protein